MDEHEQAQAGADSARMQRQRTGKKKHVVGFWIPYKYCTYCCSLNPKRNMTARDCLFTLSPWGLTKDKSGAVSLPTGLYFCQDAIQSLQHAFNWFQLYPGSLCW